MNAELKCPLSAKFWCLVIVLVQKLMCWGLLYDEGRLLFWACRKLNAAIEAQNK